MNSFLPVGKLNNKLLQDLLSEINNAGPTPKIGEDSAIISIRYQKDLLVSSDPITFDSENIGKYVLDVCANDIYAAGGEPKWFLLTTLIPPKTRYSDLKKVLSEVNERAKLLNIDIVGGHTEITEAVNKIILSGTILGTFNKNFINGQVIKENQTIILGGLAGIEGSKIITENIKLSNSKLKNLSNLASNLSISIREIAEIAISTGKIIKMHDPTEGGISTAIHEICEFSNVGCEIDINAINFVSDFKEVCETLNINPLGVISSGCLLMICEEKDSLSIVNKLNLSGINGKIIGKTTKSLNRNIIKTDGSKEKLERFDQDEIIKIFE